MIHDGVTAFVAVLSIAAIAAVVARRVLVPYVTLMSALGVVVAAAAGGRIPELNPSVVLFIFLPGLLFEASFNLDWEQLRQNLAAVLLMATVGVVLTTGLVTLVGRVALGLSIGGAVIFGAAVAATDPVAVVATFRRLGVPHRLRNLLEAESLLNDGTGVVVFTVALAAATAQSMAASSIILALLRLGAGGLVLGVALGYALSRLTGFVDDPQVEMTITAVAAYGGYLLGEAIHVSGILCVVAAGLVIGNYGRSRHMSARTREATRVLWDYVAFLLNSAVFVLIGAEVPLGLLATHASAAVTGALIVLLARAVTVYGLLALLRPVKRPVPMAWQHILVFGGLRGTVAVALLLSLPSSLPEVATIRALIYGVVLCSLFVQGAPLVPVTRRVLRSREAQAPA